MVVVVWWLLYRTTLGFEIRTAGVNPDAARYAGMRPRRLIILAMTMSGALAGMAGANELLGVTHLTQTSFPTTVGFDSIAVALLARSSPVAIIPAAILFGAMRAGAGQMQIEAKTPRELVDVLQAVILIVARRAARARPRASRARCAGLRCRRPDDHALVRQRIGSVELMDQFLYSHPDPRARLPGRRVPHRRPSDERADHPPGRDADRVRCPVRRRLRAVGRRQHRHRGNDADGRVHWLGRRDRGDSLLGPFDAWSARGHAGARSSASPAACSPRWRSRCLHAWMSISLRVDQIISGTIINIAAFGITGYLNNVIAAASPVSAGQFEQVQRRPSS